MDPQDYKQETLNAYNSNPMYFAQRFDKFSFYHDATLQRFLSKLKPNSRILDLGSGAGTYALKMQKQGHEVTCLDNSLQMAGICASRGLVAVVMDIEDISLTEQFDGIWAMTSLIHIPKSRQEKSLYGIKKSLKDDGILYIGMSQGTDDGLKEEKELPRTHRYFSRFQDYEFDAILEKVFKIDESWKTEGANKKIFYNYIARK